MVENRKLIAKNYLKGWFSIDLIAVIPFQQILESLNLNSLVRIIRIGRLYKLAKLVKLLRFMKVA